MDVCFGIILVAIVSSWVLVIMGQTSNRISKKFYLTVLIKSAILNATKINKKLKHTTAMAEVMVGNEVVFLVYSLDQSLSLDLIDLIRPHTLKQVLNYK
jgi:hypothetical protein